jgi:serine/threonine protein kinase
MDLPDAHPDHTHVISTSSFKKLNSLGSGRTGRRYLIEEKSTGRMFTIKFIPDCNIPVDSLEMLCSYNHPAVMPLTGYSPPKAAKQIPLGIVTEFMPAGSLQSHLADRKPLSDGEKMIILFGVAEGMRYLYECRCAHNNLTPSHVLLDSNLEPRISGFGLDPKGQNGLPECVHNFNRPQEVGAPLDVFCYGLVAYSVLTEHLTFEGDMTEIPGPFQRLLGQCLSENPAKRPNFHSIVTQFLRAGLTLAMSPGEEAKAKNYRARVLSPSYTVSSVVNALDQIQAIVRLNSKLEDEVARLTRNIEGLCKSVSSYEVESGDCIDHPMRTFIDTENLPTFPATNFPSRPLFSEDGGEPSRVRLARPKFSYTPIDMRRMSMKLAVPAHVAAPGANDTRLPQPTQPRQSRRNSMMPPIPQLSLDPPGGPPLSPDWSGIPRLRLASVSKQSPPGLGRVSASVSRTTRLGIRQQLSGPIMTATKFLSNPDAFPGPQCYAICAFLTSKNGGQNIASTGVVTITGNSVDPPRECLLPWLVHSGWTKCWTSENTPESWVQFDFHEKRLFVTHYEIKTYPSGPGYSHLKSWVLKGRIAADKWFDMDKRTDTVDLNGKSLVGTFFLETPREAQCIKLVQTGLNHGGDHYLILTHVEFFGKILEGPS